MWGPNYIVCSGPGRVLCYCPGPGVCVESNVLHQSGSKRTPHQLRCDLCVCFFTMLPRTCSATLWPLLLVKWWCLLVFFLDLGLFGSTALGPCQVGSLLKINFYTLAWLGSVLDGVKNSVILKTSGLWYLQEVTLWCHKDPDFPQRPLESQQPLHRNWIVLPITNKLNLKCTISGVPPLTTLWLMWYLNNNTGTNENKMNEWIAIKV